MKWKRLVFRTLCIIDPANYRVDFAYHTGCQIVAFHAKQPRYFSGGFSLAFQENLSDLRLRGLTNPGDEWHEAKDLLQERGDALLPANH